MSNSSIPHPNPLQVSELVSFELPNTPAVNGTTEKIVNKVLPKLVEVEQVDGFVSHADVRSSTRVTLAEGNHEPAALTPEPNAEWFDKHIELGVREATKTLYKKGINTFTSSANKDNFGPNKVADPHVAIRFDRNNPDHMKVLERAVELNEKEKEEARFYNRPFSHKVKLVDKGGEWDGIYIYVNGEQDRLTVGEVSSRFNAVSKFLTQDLPEVRGVDEPEIFTLNTQRLVNSDTKKFFTEKIKDAEKLGAAPEVLEILKYGTYKGERIDDIEDVARTALDVIIAREFFAEVLEKDPKTAKDLFDYKVVGFHGTSSAALSGLLEHGALLSASEAKKRGVNHATGEHIFQKVAGQGSISFANVGGIDSAFAYTGPLKPVQRSLQEVITAQNEAMELSQSALAKEGISDRFRGVIEEQIKNTRAVQRRILANSNSLEAELMMDTFPILIGINNDVALQGVEARIARNSNWSPVIGGSGAYDEFRAAREEIDLNELLIAVPESRLEKMRQLLDAHGKSKTRLVALEPLIPERYKRIHKLD